MNVAIAAPLALEAIADLLRGDVPAIRSVTGGTPIAHLVRGLVERGHDVVVVTGDIGRREEAVLDGPGLRVHVGPYRPEHRARDGFAAERDYVAGTLRLLRPDVVHAHWTYEFALGALASGCPTIVTVRDWAPTVLRYYTDPYRAVRLLMNIVTLARAPHLTATSPVMVSRLRRWAGRRATLVPNAIDDAHFIPRREVVERRIRTQEPRALAIGNGFGRLKNVTTLLHAWPRVLQMWPDADLELIGQGFDPDGPAAAWARAAGLHRGVTFTGPLPNAEAMQRLRDADVLVHPSREESFGLVLVEAMARGVPVVGGHRSGAVPWILDHGRAGLLADVRDDADLATAVIRTLGGGAEARRRALHAYDRAWDRFRLTRAIEGYEACYRARTDGQ